MPQNREKYTQPSLRDRIKKQIQAGDKGGRPGQWSARKSQLLAQEYKRRGGGYRQSKGESARSLERWQDEQWQTRSGDKRARGDGETRRYLPKEAWAQLTEAQRRRTDQRKREQSRAGRQFVANTGPARTAGRKARRGPSELERKTRQELLDMARQRDIRGRSRMTKHELARALARPQGRKRPS